MADGLAAEAQLVFVAVADGAETHLLLAGELETLHSAWPEQLSSKWAFCRLWATVLRAFLVENTQVLASNKQQAAPPVVGEERPVGGYLAGWAAKRERWMHQRRLWRRRQQEALRRERFSARLLC